MSKPIDCFWIEPTDKVAVYLRRFVLSGKRSTCSGPMGYHDARARIEDAEAERDERGHLKARSHPSSDLRWPTRCHFCGKLFADTDHRQVMQREIYSNGLTLEEQLVGAMYDATWLHDTPRCGPDGRSLMLVCPGQHTWNIDGPATNGPGWTRKGEPPKITARPSIQVPGWHGYLTEGQLIEQ